MYKVGVIGNGFVGESQVFAFSSKVEVRVYDIDPLKSKYSLRDIYECADEWVSKGHKISAGITDYFHAYFSKHAQQEGS